MTYFIIGLTLSFFEFWFRYILDTQMTPMTNWIRVPLNIILWPIYLPINCINYLKAIEHFCFSR